MIQVQHEEQYTILLPGAQTDKTAYETLADKIGREMEAGHKNFIIHLQDAKNVPEDFAHTLDHIKQIIGKEEGILVVSAAPENMEVKLQEKEIITTPTLDEATDYIFMEEIEKQFRSEGDDEPEEWESED